MTGFEPRTSELPATALPTEPQSLPSPVLARAIRTLAFRSGVVTSSQRLSDEPNLEVAIQKSFDPNLQSTGLHKPKS